MVPAVKDQSALYSVEITITELGEGSIHSAGGSHGLYEVYLHPLGLDVSITRAAMLTQFSLPAGLSIPAEAQMLQAPSMLLGQAIKSLPENCRWPSFTAHPLRWEFLGAG